MLRPVYVPLRGENTRDRFEDRAEYHAARSHL